MFFFINKTGALIKELLVKINLLSNNLFKVFYNINNLSQIILDKGPNGGFCHGASCFQANGAEGRKDDRLRKEKKRRGRNLIKVDRYLQGKRGVPITGKFRLVAGNTIRAEARYITPPL